MVVFAGIFVEHEVRMRQERRVAVRRSASQMRRIVVELADVLARDELSAPVIRELVVQLQDHADEIRGHLWLGRRRDVRGNLNLAQGIIEGAIEGASSVGPERRSLGVPFGVAANQLDEIIDLTRGKPYKIAEILGHYMVQGGDPGELLAATSNRRWRVRRPKKRPVEDGAAESG